jgi:hypothetical protein
MSHAWTPAETVAFILQLLGAAQIIATALGGALTKVAPTWAHSLTAWGVDFAKLVNGAEAVEPIVEAVVSMTETKTTTTTTVPAPHPPVDPSPPAS